MSKFFYHFTKCNNARNIVKSGYKWDSTLKNSEFQFILTSNRMGNGIYFFFKKPIQSEYHNLGCYVRSEISPDSRILFTNREMCSEFYGRDMSLHEQFMHLFPTFDFTDFVGEFKPEKYYTSFKRPKLSESEVNIFKGMRKPIKHSNSHMLKQLNQIYNSDSFEANTFMNLFYKYIVEKNRKKVKDRYSKRKIRTIRNLLDIDGVGFRTEGSQKEGWVIVYNQDIIVENKAFDINDNPIVDDESDKSKPKRKGFMSFLKGILKEEILKVLNEGKIDDFIKQNQEFEPYREYIEQIPSPSYLSWFKKIIQEPGQIAQVIDLIIQFHSKKQSLSKKDLNQYKSIDELISALNSLTSNKCASLINKMGGAELIYEDEEWCVVLPSTTKSACFWGKNTKWCTAYTKSGNRFLSYSLTHNLHLYHLIKKDGNAITNPFDKMVMAYMNDEESGVRLITNANGTVNAVNDDISKNQIIDVLGSRGTEIVNIIERDVSVREATSAKKIVQNMDVEELKEQLEIMEMQEDSLDSLRKSLEFLNFVLKHNQNEEVLSFAESKRNEISLKILWEMSESSDRHVRMKVAGMSDSPPEILMKLSGDDEPVVRMKVALNRNCPPEALMKLSKDFEDKVRSGVAYNENCPPEILMKLSGDDEPNVRMHVADNRNCPPEILMKLSGDDEPVVRMRVAGNRNCPIKALLILIKDPEPKVRQTAKYNPRYQEYIRNQENN